VSFCNTFKQGCISQISLGGSEFWVFDIRTGTVSQVGTSTWWKVARRSLHPGVERVGGSDILGKGVESPWPRQIQPCVSLRWDSPLNFLHVILSVYTQVYVNFSAHVTRSLQTTQSVSEVAIMAAVQKRVSLSTRPSMSGVYTPSFTRRISWKRRTVWTRVVNLGIWDFRFCSA